LHNFCFLKIFQLLYCPSSRKQLMDKSKGILVFFIIVFWLDSLLDYEQISIFINLNNDKKKKDVGVFCARVNEWTLHVLLGDACSVIR
jgi:hypothetical protein